MISGTEQENSSRVKKERSKEIDYANDGNCKECHLQESKVSVIIMGGHFWNFKEIEGYFEKFCQK